MGRFLRYTLAIAASLILTPTSWSADGASATPSDPNTPAKTVNSTVADPNELIARISSNQRALAQMLGAKYVVFKSEANRKAAAPKLVPLMHSLRDDLDELATVAPQFKPKIVIMQDQLQAMLSDLGDQAAIDQINSGVASQDTEKAVQAQSERLLSRWYVADASVAAQSKIVKDLEKLDRAHPKNITLTLLTASLSHDAASADLKQKMLAIATEEMSNPAATSIKTQMAAMKAAAEKAAGIENKPLTIAGTTPDGKAFTTADWKGKVVLVDFWATWCGPCKEELPRVKKMYADYHAKGLEVVSVSNDYDVEALKTFTAAEKMTWPELFDPQAAANKQWNSITVAQGIQGIPVMYLIDKKGILRSVSARENMEEMIPQLLAE